MRDAWDGSGGAAVELSIQAMKLIAAAYAELRRRHP